MNNYSELSKLAINRACAIILFPDSHVPEIEDMAFSSNQDAAQVIHEVGISGEYVDYCGNPADSWKLMVDNRIQPVWAEDELNHTEGWSDFHNEYITYDAHNDGCDSPGRAVAICFLMIKGGEV